MTGTKTPHLDTAAHFSLDFLQGIKVKLTIGNGSRSDVMHACNPDAWETNIGAESSRLALAM